MTIGREAMFRATFYCIEAPGNYQIGEVHRNELPAISPSVLQKVILSVRQRWEACMNVEGRQLRDIIFQKE